MKLRKLRIVWSAVCGIICLLLITLWVRSYWRLDKIVWTGDAGTFALSTDRGKLTIEIMNQRVLLPLGWSRGSFSISDDDSVSDELNTLLGFGWQTEIGSVTAAVPFWFLVLTSAVVTAAPWFRWRFSVRTLLIAMTLAAVLLGAVVYAVR